MSGIPQDLRFGFRLLRRSPGFTAVAVLSLALGIGANTAIFSVMDALLLRSLPVREPNRLVLFGRGRAVGIFDEFPDRDRTDLYSVPFYRRVRANNSVFTDVAAVESMLAEPHARIGAGNAELEPLKIRLVSGNYFQLLGVGASLGRVFSSEDDLQPGAHPVAVLSHAFWEGRFARDAGIAGKTLSFNGTVYTIVGVAAPDFSGTMVGESPDVWLPLSMLARVMPWMQGPWDEMSQSLRVIARLRPDASLATAQASVNVTFQQWMHQVSGPTPSPERVTAMRKALLKLTPMAKGTSDLRLRYERPLQILMGLVGVVLLIACANIANLLLARGTGRRREIAVRLAMGAPRRRLVAQLVCESLLLALTGGALGLLIASWGGELLLSMVAAHAVPLDIGLNLTALLFTLALSLGTGLLFGILPALPMTRVDLGPSLKEGKGAARLQTRSRIQQALVAAQVGLALFLTIAAGLFIGTLRNMEQISAGFDQEHVIVVDLDTDWTVFPRAAWLNLSRRLEARLRSLPGVESASFALVTFNGGDWMIPMWPAGTAHTDANQRTFEGNRVGAEYFRTMGMPLLAGRTFSPADTEHSQHVAVVNQTLARQLFGSEPALGKHFSLSGRDRYDFEIVGVVKDAHYDSLREKPQGMWFVYTEQEPEIDSTLVVRTRGNPAAVMPLLRPAITAEDPNLAVSSMATLQSMVRDSLRRENLLAELAAFFGAVALLLACIGLYGVMAYSVARRTSEIGIRMALGAQPGAMLRMVIREALVLLGVGFAIGIPAALASGRLIASQLYGVQPSDPWTILAAAAVLLLVTIAAAYVPARRAALLEPLAALRDE